MGGATSVVELNLTSEAAVNVRVESVHTEREPLKRGEPCNHKHTDYPLKSLSYIRLPIDLLFLSSKIQLKGTENLTDGNRMHLVFFGGDVNSPVSNTQMKAIGIMLLLKINYSQPPMPNHYLDIHMPFRRGYFLRKWVVGKL